VVGVGGGGVGGVGVGGWGWEWGFGGGAEEEVEWEGRGGECWGSGLRISGRDGREGWVVRWYCSDYQCCQGCHRFLISEG